MNAVLTLAMIGSTSEVEGLRQADPRLRWHTPGTRRTANASTTCYREMGIDLLITCSRSKEGTRGQPDQRAVAAAGSTANPRRTPEILGNLGLIIGGGFDTTLTRACALRSGS